MERPNLYTLSTIIYVIKSLVACYDASGKAKTETSNDIRFSALIAASRSSLGGDNWMTTDKQRAARVGYVWGAGWVGWVAITY